MPITIKNKTVFDDQTTTGSGSFTIPSTQAGNLLVILVVIANATGDINTAINFSDNVADTFLQPNWPSLPLCSTGAGKCFIPTTVLKFPIDMWYCVTKGGATTINWHLLAGGSDPCFRVFEFTGMSAWALGQIGATAFGGSVSAPWVGPALNSAIADNAYFSVILTAGGFYFSGPTVSNPWTLEPATAFEQSDGTSSWGIAYIVDGTGSQTASYSSGDSPDNYTILGAVFSGTGGGGGGGGGVPILPGGGGTGGGPSSGGGCSSTLNISPATELYQVFVPASAMAVSEYITEGRTAAVIDFNAGDGIYSRDIETMFAWGLTSHYAIRVWQPSEIPMPENQFNRPSDWNDAGSPGNKFIQGITIEADSFNLPKVFQLQSADDLSLHALNEMPTTFPKQTIKTFSCVTPFLAHSIRVFATDGVAWRMWDSTPIFQPWPSQVMNWQSEQTSFGMTGWLHAREFNVAYASSQPITINLVPDTGPTVTLTLPSSGGPLIQSKTKQTLPAMKFKLLSVQVVSTAPFYLFETDLEFKIKAWGSTDPYQVLKVVGGPSRPGAAV